MKLMMRFLSFVLLAGLFVACNTAKKQAKEIQIEFGKKPTIVYKTKSDYFDKVPVSLSEDKSKIVAYPAPQDVYYNDQLAYPTRLENGYLLDNRGISSNTAFLNITYEEYSKLKQTPSLDEMQNMLLDKDPILECYDCGNITEEEKLNILIKGKALSKCKRMGSK